MNFDTPVLTNFFQQRNRLLGTELANYFLVYLDSVVSFTNWKLR